MVIVRLWGGLGNQMFQYACGYAVAKRNNTDLLLDTRFYTEEYLEKNPHFSKQKPNILQFPLDFYSVTNEDNRYKAISFFQERSVSRLIRLPNKFNIKIDDDILYCKETRLKYLRYINELRHENIYLDGYWQCEGYFKEFRDDIKRQYTRHSEKAKQSADDIGALSSCSVAVHVRLGDFSSSKKRKITRCNSIVNPKYYINAMEMMRERIPNSQFYIFSNDMKKAKELLDGYNCCFVNEDRTLSDFDEFEVMSLCKHHIISNSTFSWWAAWLASDDGYTISPDYFAGNEQIIPDSWTKISINE